MGSCVSVCDIPGKMSDCCIVSTDPKEIFRTRRRCTDLLCLIIFALFWVGMFIIGGIAINQGEPKRLIFGTDYEGKLCGGDDRDGRDYLTYPRTNEDFLANLGKQPQDYKFYGVCVESCPDRLDVVCNEVHPQLRNRTAYPMADLLECFNQNAAAYDSSLCRNTVRPTCWVIPQKTSSVLYRCIPVYNVDSNATLTCTYPEGADPRSDVCIIVREDRSGSVERPARPNLVFDQLNSARELWGRYFGDLNRAWWVILVCGGVIALGLGFVWLVFIKFCAWFIVWFSLIGVLMIEIALTVYFFYRGGVISQDQIPGLEDVAFLNESANTFQVPLTSADDQEYAFQVLAYVGVFVVILSIILILWFRSAISQALKLIKLATIAMGQMPALLICPLFSVVGMLLFLVWWVFVAAGLYSAGEVTTTNFTDAINAQLDTYPASVRSQFNITGADETFKTLEISDVTQYLIIYHGFGLLWTNNFVIGLTFTSMSAAVGSWYFSRNGDSAAAAGLAKQEMPRFPILSGLWTMIRYHIGSIALGSFILAVVQAIRIVFEYIARKAKQDENKQSQLMKYLICCIRYLLACIQKCVEMITRNAYIYVALQGDAFCDGAGHAIAFIMTELRLFTAVNYIGEVIMFLGKVLIASASGFIAFAIIENSSQFQSGGDSEIMSSWLPVLVTMIFAFFVAAAFFIVYDICVDTLLICYGLDKKSPNGPHHLNSIQGAKADFDSITSTEAAAEGGAGSGGATAGGAAAKSA